MGETKLTDHERAVYEWQMWSPQLGERGQEVLKGAAVLITRCGGVGGAVAYYLAAAGIGRLVLAHEGNVKPSDLNRQILMTHDGLGKPRLESAERRLHDLNPRVKIETVYENANDTNARELVGRVDLIVDCAPMFQERFALNREAVVQKKTMVECAMFDFEAQITTIIPGVTPCLACRHPSEPEGWKRQFPVFGAVAGMVGAMGAVEAIKILSGIGSGLAGELLMCDLTSMSFRKIKLRRNTDCRICGNVSA